MKVKKLGVAEIESQSIPMEVELEDGSISSDKSVVMSKWLHGIFQVTAESRIR